LNHTSFNRIDLPVPHTGELWYAKHFLSSEAASEYFKVLRVESAWQQETVRVYGKNHLTPRLVSWYGDPGASYAYSGIFHQPRPWTAVLRALRDAVCVFSDHSFNSVLLNYYRNGDDSIGWHSDREPELGDHPCIASVSLGVTRRFCLKSRSVKRQAKRNMSFAIDLEHGSLLLMTGSLQQHWRHCVPKQPSVREERINLTFRNIVGTQIPEH